MRSCFGHVQFFETLWTVARQAPLLGLGILQARILEWHYQRNANQNHSKVPSHASQNGWYQKVYKQCWRGCREKGTLLHRWWECKLVQPLWRTVWRFLKRLEIELPYDPAIPLGLNPTHQGNQNWKRHMYPNVHHSTVYNSQDMEAI